MYWSLPIGNGYFGVNTFGRTETERLQITDKTLTNPWQANYDPYPQIGGLNNFSETYLDFNHTNDDVSNYYRYLDLETAISGVNVRTSEWIHLTIAFDVENSFVHLYTNGELKSSKAISGDFSDYIK